jgi:hypothetical protein
MPSGQRKKSITFNRNNRAAQKSRMLKKPNIYSIKMVVAPADEGLRTSALDASRECEIGMWKTRRRKTRGAAAMRQR